MHTTVIRPIFGDVDAMNVVYYANYLRYFEKGRAELMRSTGGTYAELEQQGLHLPVTEVNIRYRSSARYDEEVSIHTSVAWMKKASLQFTYELTAPDGDGGPRLLVTGFTSHGCVDKQGRIRPLPDWVKESLGRHLA